MKKVSYIYGLVDPRDDLIKYVGKTVNPKRRLQAHWSEPSNRAHTKKGNWIKHLKKSGLKPTMVLIEECGDDWAEREKFWIKFFKLLGLATKNGNEGGVGAEVGHKCSMETRQKLRQANKGRPCPQKTRDAVSKAHKGKIVSKETREKLSKAKKGRIVSEETRKKMSEAISRPINQFSLDGTFIRTWPSIKEAVVSLGVGVKSGSCIRNVLSKKMPQCKTAHGYLWARPGDIPEIPLTKEERISRFVRKKIVQYSLDGTKIRCWESATQAAKELGLAQGHITRSCRQGGTAYGFNWEYDLDGN